MLNQLYQEIILEHNSKSPHRGELTNPSHVERGHNPSCGDDLTLMVNLVDNVIEDAKFIGVGCAISTASMSMMIDLVKGKTIVEARELTALFLSVIQGKTLSKEDKKRLKDSMIFESLKDMPARVKCGTLGWHCLDVIVNDKK